MRKMSTIQKVNWYKNLNNCGHTENLGALFLTKVVTKFHNNTESILLRYLWSLAFGTVATVCFGGKRYLFIFHRYGVSV